MILMILTVNRMAVFKIRKYTKNIKILDKD